MYFNVYFDPQVIDVARNNGHLGLQALIAILRGFSHNCFLAVFPNDEDEIKAAVESLAVDADRNELKRILVHLAKNRRFVYSFKPNDYLDDKSVTILKDSVCELIDALVLAADTDEYASLKSVSVIAFEGYQRSRFEQERSTKAAHGETLTPSSWSAQEFFERYLRTPLRHSRRLEILDKQMAKNYGDHYAYALKKLLTWLSSVVVNQDKYRLTIYSLDNQTDPTRIADLIADLKSIRSTHLKDFEINVILYDSAFSASMPHDRFILTDQVAVGIPRGMDFLDPACGRIRDITLDCKDKNDLGKFLDHYSGYRLEEYEIS